MGQERWRVQRRPLLQLQVARHRALRGFAEECHRHRPVQKTETHQRGPVLALLHVAELLVGSLWRQLLAPHAACGQWQRPRRREFPRVALPGPIRQVVGRPDRCAATDAALVSKRRDAEGEAASRHPASRGVPRRGLGRDVRQVLRQPEREALLQVQPMGLIQPLTRRPEQLCDPRVRRDSGGRQGVLRILRRQVSQVHLPGEQEPQHDPRERRRAGPRHPV